MMLLLLLWEPYAEPCAELRLMHAEIALPHTVKVASVGSTLTMGHSTAMHAFKFEHHLATAG